MPDDLQPPDVQLPEQQPPDVSPSPQETLANLPRIGQQQDPTELVKQNLAQRYLSYQQPAASGGPIRRFLQNFLSGGGEAMMHKTGVETPQQAQERTLRDLSNVTASQSLESMRQSQEQHLSTQDELLRRSIENQSRTPVTADEPLGKTLPWLVNANLTPGERAGFSKQFMASQTATDVATIRANATQARPSAAARDDRFIKLSGVPQSTWTAEDRQFMQGYQKYVDVTKTQPGVARAQVFAAPRWASLDPERQAQISMAKSLASGLFANQLTSFNAFLGHLGDLKDSVGALNNLDARFLNMPINRIKLQTGNQAIQAVIAKIEPVRKEFESLLLNNRALYEMDRKSADTILSEDASPAQMQTAMKSLAHTAAIRLGAVNSTIKRVARADIPGIVEPASGAVLSEFGEEIPDYQGGGSFGDIFKSPQGPPNRSKAGRPQPTHRYNPVTKRIEPINAR
jgi:hypothetical protein